MKKKKKNVFLMLQIRIMRENLLQMAKNLAGKIGAQEYPAIYVHNSIFKNEKVFEIENPDNLRLRRPEKASYII